MLKKAAAGFTLIEAVVVLAVLAVMTGMILPLSSKLTQREREISVRTKLRAIQQALDDYFYDNSEYPPSLTDGSFLRPYHFPGIDIDGLVDDLSADASDFQFYAGASNPLTVTVWSVGPDGTDDSSGGGATMGGDDLYIVSYSEIPGRQRTQLKMTIIGAAFARFLYDAGTTHTLAANWADRATMMLLGEFEKDGFNRSFDSFAQPAAGSAYDTAMIYSYGPDGVDNSGSSSSDDIIF